MYCKVGSLYVSILFFCKRNSFRLYKAFSKDQFFPKFLHYTYLQYLSVCLACLDTSVLIIAYSYCFFCVPNIQSKLLE